MLLQDPDAPPSQSPGERNPYLPHFAPFKSQARVRPACNPSSPDCWMLHPVMLM